MSYNIKVGGREYMNMNFIITKIENIIYVDKNQYPEKDYGILRQPA